MDGTVSRFPRWTIALQLLLVAGAAWIAYYNSLEVPFYLDDGVIVAKIAAVQDLKTFSDLAQLPADRYLGFLSLVANHQLHGSDVTGYHITNVMIHLGAGIAVFFFVSQVLRIPAIREAFGENSWQWLPLLVALLFVLHPLQSQAVTYVVQRFTSLAALFYVLSLACYVKGRVDGRPLLFAASLLFAVMAWFSKQNAATLPVAILLVEFFLLRQLSARQLVAFVTAAGAAGLALLLVAFHFFDDATRETHSIGRMEYFAAQSKVLWRYLGLVFFPVGQRLEYDVDPEPDIFAPEVMLAIAGHATLVLLALLLWRRQALVTFGILFYYLAHAVESCCFPIKDLAFEHRTYLPNLGIFLVVGVAGVKLAEFNRMRRVSIVLGVAILGGLTWATVQRNALWQEPLEFLTRDTELSPGKSRTWAALGNAYMSDGSFTEALEAFEKALDVGRTPEGFDVQPRTMLNAVITLYFMQRVPEAEALEAQLPLSLLERPERSKLAEAKGYAALKQHRYDEARGHFFDALEAFPNHIAESGIAYVDLVLGRNSLALGRAQRVLKDHPENTLAQLVVRKASGEGGGAAASN